MSDNNDDANGHAADIRAGEICLDRAPDGGDAGLSFIGEIETSWAQRGDCPRNITQARERDGWSRLHVAEHFRLGLTDLATGDAIIVLYWLDQARRDLIVQSPRHRNSATGVFNLRSPVRPNPIGLAVTTVRAIDIGKGEIEIDPLDCVNGTPLIDIKPWMARIDMPAGFTPAV